MTKVELEKQIKELRAMVVKQREHISILEQRTATKETVADIVREFYAQYIIRRAVVLEWGTLGYMEQDDIDIQKRIAQQEYERYRGVMSAYCRIFEKDAGHERRQGDWRWSPWANYDLTKSEAMAARPEWKEAIERLEKAEQTRFDKERRVKT